MSEENIRQTPVRAVMTPKVITLPPDVSIRDVQERCDEADINHLPIVADNRVVGMISRRDLFQLQHSFTAFQTPESLQQNDELFQRILARDLMVEPVHTVSPDATLAEAARIFEAEKFHALPVVDSETGALIGILTAMDLLNYAYLSR